MRARDYLLRIWELDEYIKDKRDEIERAEESAKGLGGSSNSEKVQTSPVPDKLEKSVIAYTSLKEKLTDDLIRIEAERSQIIRTIELLPLKEYTVIYRVYVHYMTYDEIADEINKSYSYVSKRHSKGLKILQEIINERYDTVKGGH